MPTILTKGLGYDEPTIVYHDIASELIASVVLLARIAAIVVPEEPPVGRVRATPVSLFGTVTLSDALRGVVSNTQAILGVLKEEGPLMSLEVNKITMFIRDDRTLSVSVNQDDGTPVNLTSAKIWFTVKARTSDTDDQALIQKKNTAAGGGDDQIKIVVAAQGKMEVYLVPDDTEDLDPGTYIYDIQVTLASGKTYTVARDKITFKEDVTKTMA